MREYNLKGIDERVLFNPGRGVKSRLKKQSKSAVILSAEKPRENWDEECVVISLKYFSHNRECFSDWDKQQLRAFWNFNEKIHQITWRELKRQASAGANKRGFAPTKMPLSAYPGDLFKSEMSEDVAIIELRVNERMRVHGFREKQLFHLCLLDKDHKYGK